MELIMHTHCCLCKQVYGSKNESPVCAWCWIKLLKNAKYKYCEGCNAKFSPLPNISPLCDNCVYKKKHKINNMNYFYK